MHYQHWSDPSASANASGYYTVLKFWNYLNLKVLFHRVNESLIHVICKTLCIAQNEVQYCVASFDANLLVPEHCLFSITSKNSSSQLPLRLQRWAGGSLEPTTQNPCIEILKYPSPWSPPVRLQQYSSRLAV